MFVILRSKDWTALKEGEESAMENADGGGGGGTGHFTAIGTESRSD